MGPAPEEHQAHGLKLWGFCPIQDQPMNTVQATATGTFCLTLLFLPFTVLYFTLRFSPCHSSHLPGKSSRGRAQGSLCLSPSLASQPITSIPSPAALLRKLELSCCRLLCKAVTGAVSFTTFHSFPPL